MLRPRTLQDTEHCLSMDRDPEVTRFVSGPWADPAAHRAFVEQRTLGPYPPGLGYWTIRERDEPTVFLGWVLLIPVDAVGPEIEIGWRLVRSAWGRGLAVEAARPILRYGLMTMRLPEVMAEIDPRNLRSQRVAEKLGLQRRGTVFRQGESQSDLRYSLRFDEAGPEIKPLTRKPPRPKRGIRTCP